MMDIDIPGLVSALVQIPFVAATIVITFRFVKVIEARDAAWERELARIDARREEAETRFLTILSSLVEAVRKGHAFQLAHDTQTRTILNMIKDGEE